MRFNFFIALSFVLGSAASCLGEDIIWRVMPTSAGKVTDRVVASSALGPGGGFNFQATYALANVFVDPDQCDDAQPGVINQISTFFEDDGLSFGKVDGIARLNVFVVPGPEILPLTDDDPDFGLIVPVTYMQTVVGGMDVIQVQANGLANLNQPIVIEPGVRYYIGLTPIFTKGDELFVGNHLANFAAKDAESASATRTTAPPPDTDWDFAEDPDTGDRLYASIEIRGFTTPNIYLSPFGFGEGAQPEHQSIALATGSSTLMHVWVDESLPVDTLLSLNVQLQTPGIAEFNISDVFEADIVIAGVPVDTRWGIVNPGMVSPLGQFISNMIGSALDGGTGIVPMNTGPMFLDTLYDPTAGAFLYGIVEVTAISEGTTEVILSEGGPGIVNSGPSPVPVFGSLTICNVILGDLNGDGSVNLLDVAPFVDLLANGGFQFEGDINKDGCVDLLDVGPFVDVLSSG